MRRALLALLLAACVTIPQKAGADPSAARSALESAIGASQEAIGHCQTALAALPADDPATNSPTVGGQVQLGTFAWSASGIVDPAGWPYAKRSAPTEAYGKRNLQWYERWKPGGGGILHAAWPLASASASGASAVWYFFRPGTVPANPPDERLRAYRWQQMGGPRTDSAGTWIKYRRLP